MVLMKDSRSDGECSKKSVATESSRGVIFPHVLKSEDASSFCSSFL